MVTVWSAHHRLIPRLENSEWSKKRITTPLAITVKSVVTTITLPAPRIVGGLCSVRVTVRSRTFGGIRASRSARSARFLASRGRPDGSRTGFGHPPRMPLYLTEQDVAGLLTPADAVEAVEESFRRLARGAVDNRPRERLPLDEGQFAVMACVDRELGYAGLKSYAWTRDGTPFVVAALLARARAARGA